VELRSILARLRIFGLPAKAGLGIFLDTGKVGQTWGRLLDDELHTTGGFSLLGSYFTDDFLGSLDVAFSREGYTAQIQMGHAF
jgi:hypothetical protein